ncbi:carbamoyl phosphate synthase large subunit [Mycoplasma sp. (ex Biomphalaria glabrata)]|nr:carbamoyl-phosphate synthase large subunit [Mycoplasma sp. (ex Biomphalaria glabrata)]ALV23314.1 carbamoyl phosphate synthase large subunit [Mycoplasma sp. (ex Biomphalaria glabrata)]
MTKNIKKILVIGSGPIIIGQAAEFDYSGTQACLSLKEEGYEVILVNPNPATIMTDSTIASKVYMEPLEVDFVKWIISRERPDAILPTLGGQVALNLTFKLHKEKILEKYNVKILGTSIDAIVAAEDRLIFKKTMEDINISVAPSSVVKSIEEAEEFIEEIGLPVVIRPSYTMGGAGGGIANTKEELHEILSGGLRLSPIGECLVEKSIYGYKEIEYEVMRDSNDTAIIVCNMENIDPVGIHTGDSMVVAPSLTLTNKQYQILRDASLKIVKHLKIEGGCNVQIALDPYSEKFYVIEINPRVSRSSALASKATGYPIAKISAKIAIGKNLHEIVYNDKNKNVKASLEPAIDYIVTKLARFPFDKFRNEKNIISTQMQATGEVMAIGRNFEESFLKAIRGLEIEQDFIWDSKILQLSKEELLKQINIPNGYRIYQIFAALKKGVTVEEIYQNTKITKYFLNKFRKIVDLTELVEGNKNNLEILKEAKKYGISDHFIACSWETTEKEIFHLRKNNKILPVYKIIDTCASEFKATTPYLYSTYGLENESVVSKNKKILIIGSGPIRIGQGVEFDYSTVHSIWAFKKLGYEVIIVNNNPETVSTDYTIADKLYFEPITYEDVMNIIQLEKPNSVVLQFGGQTALNLTKYLINEDVLILGTSLENIDKSEDREEFAKVLDKLNILSPEHGHAKSVEDAKKIVKKIGYPVMARPSYVIGGQSMEILRSDEDLEYLNNIKPSKTNKNLTILIDKYINGIEVEVDVVSDGKDIFIPGIMEHIERAGVHSGDSTTTYPTISISEKDKSTIVNYMKKISQELNVIGLMNAQLIVDGGKVYLLEINLRSSRTIPFISKARKINVIEMAAKVMAGQKIKNMIKNIAPEDHSVFYIKGPVFSFAKLWKISDLLLGPEMKSTGESIGIDIDFSKALYKALLSAGQDLLKHHSIIISCHSSYHEKILESAKLWDSLQYKIYATPGTHTYLKNNGIKTTVVQKLGKDNNIIDLISKEKLSFIINTPSSNSKSRKNLQEMRQFAIANGVPLISNIDLASFIARLCVDMKYLIKPL